MDDSHRHFRVTRDLFSYREALKQKSQNPFNWDWDLWDFVWCIDQIVELLPEKSTVVDIGVDTGISTMVAASSPNVAKVISIDPYIEYSQSHFFPYGQTGAHDWFVENVVKKESKIEFHRMMSHDAAALIPDKSVDMVIIDGNHDYEFAKDDIIQYLPKIKSGGILMGHDYNSAFPGVIQACQETIGNPDMVLKSWHFVKKIA